ncbi:MAG: hypothetical protein B7Z37_23780 [Verrucomicrobia bacterium 12-59-8]|nr:MAG: hypothetical protein B7Z37_23780 [Verrucomicrobia bacterium 12-59-8]
MKFFGWLYFALLVAIQLIGWFGYGRPAAWTALMVIVLPSSILSGAAFFWFYYWNRTLGLIACRDADVHPNECELH